MIMMACNASQSTSTNVVNIKYWNKTAPKDVAVVFSKGYISQEFQGESKGLFTPDGSQFFFTETNYFKQASIQQKSVKGNVWSTPSKASFSNKDGNWDVAPSPDGDYLVFLSSRPPSYSSIVGKPWITYRADDGSWNEPEFIELPMPDEQGIWNPCITQANRMYYGAYFDSGEQYGQSDIYVTQLFEDSLKIKNIGPEINTYDHESHPYIAPDESYMLFSSDRPGGVGKNDIYVSFAKDGVWQTPLNLGPLINSVNDEKGAWVTPDNRFILFDRSYDQVQDLYWVRTDVIDKLR